MKRVLTVATAGLFMTGLALLPISVRAEQAVSVGKDGKPVVSSTVTPSVVPSVAPPVAPMGSAAHSTTSVVKKTEDKKVTVAPGAGHGAVMTPSTATTSTTSTSTATVPSATVPSATVPSATTHGTTAPATGVTTVKPPVKGAS